MDSAGQKAALRVEERLRLEVVGIPRIRVRPLGSPVVMPIVARPLAAGGRPLISISEVASFCPAAIA